MIRINQQVILADDDIRFEFSTSRGPGGQNVNKVATRATLLFDLENCRALTDVQRERIRASLAGRIDASGILRVNSSDHRSQSANRRAAVERLVELLAAALRPRRKRRPTRPTTASKERRLTAKSQRSEIKRDRTHSRRPTNE